jgi:hypothetical protein
MYMKTIKFYKFAGLSHRYRISLLIGATVLIVCGAVFGRDGKLPVESTSPRLVRSFTVISAQGGVAEYTGVIHARKESDLGFRVSGNWRKLPSLPGPLRKVGRQLSERGGFPSLVLQCTAGTDQRQPHATQQSGHTLQARFWPEEVS